MPQQELEILFPNAEHILYYSEVDNYEKISYEFYENHQREAAEIENLLEDDLSKKSLEAFLNSKINEDLSFVLPYVVLPQYAPIINVSSQKPEHEFLNFTTDEVLVNCGAYTGDTILLFAKEKGVKFKKIFAIEPDPNNYTRLYETIKTNLLESIVSVFECGLSDKDEILTFQSGENSKSVLSSEGNISIKLKKIDDIVGEERITFINMDIEGAEFKALQGAERVISKWKPKLAISAYHMKEDWYRLAQLIHSFNPEYRFFFRLHKPKAIDAVLYAI